jgi:hypothetical protein
VNGKKFFASGAEFFRAGKSFLRVAKSFFASGKNFLERENLFWLWTKFFRQAARVFN